MRASGIGLVSPLVLVLAGVFVAPLLFMFPTSFHPYVPGQGIGTGWTLENYIRPFVDGYYREVILRTLWIGFVVTLIALLIGYPLAYFMARTTRTMRAVATLLVMFPLFLNLVVRSFGWIALLSNRGVVNNFLIYLGVIDHPIRMLFNMTGLVVGMVHIYLPFMVFMLLASINGIPRDVEDAAATLEATPLQIFFKVTLPLTASGILAGCTIVFILTISALVTPRLLGGPTYKVMSTLIYDEFLQKLDWPSGTAFAFILTAIALVVIWFGNRIARRFAGGAW
jgi:putative spermidine/putrescine transport system permease protein